MDIGLGNLLGGTIGGLFSGIGNIVSGTKQSSATRYAADLQADAAVADRALQKEMFYTQLDYQTEANQQEQLFNIKQANMAFARNSAQGQLAQLIAAGLSEQQARQVIAGIGATGEYTPAAAVNQMQGIDYTAYADRLSQINQTNAEAQGRLAQQGAAATAQAWQGGINAIGTIGQSLVQAFTSDNGGDYGATTANPAIEFFTKNIDLVDKSKVHNFVDFKSWIKSLDPNSDAGKVFCPFLDSGAFKTLENFSPAAKAFNSYMNSIYSNNMSSAAIFDSTLQASKLTYAQTILAELSQEFQVQATNQMKEQISLTAEERELTKQKQDSEKLAQRNLLASCINSELQNKLFEKELPYITQSDIAQFTASASEAAAQVKKWKDPFYVEQWLRAEMATEEGRALCAILANHKSIVADNALDEHPGLASFAAVMNIWNSAGIDISGTANSVVNSYRGWQAAKKIVAALPK